MPFFSILQNTLFIFSKRITTISRPFHKSLHFTMSDSQSQRSNKPNSQIAPTNLDNYPKTLSPPLPLLSKNMELNKTMSESESQQSNKPNSQNAPTDIDNYPKPLSPPLPLISKNMELNKTMSESESQQSNNPNSQNAPTNLDNYPKPLSPPLPLVSKSMELNRAMSASSRSSLFVLKRSDVVFEDEWLIVVNKPSGVYCESVLASAPHLLSEVTEKTKVTEFHLANRLDRDTSGVMVITKSHKVAAKLIKAFTDHKVRKKYLALCIGPAPEWEKITIKSGHGRSKFGAWRVYAVSDVGRTLPGGSSVRDMETSFEVLSINGKERSDLRNDVETRVVVEEKSIKNNDDKKDEILVRACPRSGRTHQIRLHCQYLGISIRGDVKYEGACEWKGKSYDGHELHAESLYLVHPVTGLPVVFQAPLPLWASEALQPL